jgi:hypothetical protein
MEHRPTDTEIARFSSSNMILLLMVWTGLFGYCAVRGLLDGTGGQSAGEYVTAQTPPPLAVALPEDATTGLRPALIMSVD